VDNGIMDQWEGNAGTAYEGLRCSNWAIGGASGFE